MIKTLTYRVDTDRRTDTKTDRKVKTEGLKILSNDNFYFKTVIIGGPITRKNAVRGSRGKDLLLV